MPRCVSSDCSGATAISTVDDDRPLLSGSIPTPFLRRSLPADPPHPTEVQR